MSDNSIDQIISRVSFELDSIKLKLNKLSDIVSDSADGRPLIVKIALLEESIHKLREEIDEVGEDIGKDLTSFRDSVGKDIFTLRAKLDALDSSINGQSIEETKGRWTLYAGVLAGLISLVGIIVSTVGPALVNRYVIEKPAGLEQRAK